jgi:hypothetical protein
MGEEGPLGPDVLPDTTFQGFALALRTSLRACLDLNVLMIPSNHTFLFVTG